jgi:hypothetical protein
MKKNNIFHLEFDKNYFKKGDIISVNNTRLKVLREPGKTWYKLLFQVISFGWYKAPMEIYKCKVIEK